MVSTLLLSETVVPPKIQLPVVAPVQILDATCAAIRPELVVLVIMLVAVADKISMPFTLMLLTVEVPDVRASDNVKVEAGALKLSKAVVDEDTSRTERHTPLAGKLGNAILALATELHHLMGAGKG